MSGSLMSCGAAIKAAAPGLSDDDIEELLSAMIRREKGMPNRGGDRLRWQQAAQEMAAEEKQALAIERHARQAALLARVARDARYADGMNPVQHLSDLI